MEITSRIEHSLIGAGFKAKHLKITRARDPSKMTVLLGIIT